MTSDGAPGICILQLQPPSDAPSGVSAAGWWHWVIRRGHMAPSAWHAVGRTQEEPILGAWPCWGKPLALFEPKSNRIRGGSGLLSSFTAEWAGVLRHCFNEGEADAMNPSRPGSASQDPHWLAVWPWASHSASVGLSFLVCRLSTASHSYLPRASCVCRLSASKSH